jgi:ribosome-associated protein
MPRTRSEVKTETVDRFAHQAAQLLADRRCEDIRLLDVRGLSHVCDYMLIASGTSERQMKSLAAELQDVGTDQGVKTFRTEADTGNSWVVVDFVDLVVHLFEPAVRGYYDLEGLWSDGDLIDWRRADQKKAHRHEGEIGLGAFSEESD